MRVSLADVCSITMGQAPPGSSYNEEGRGVPLIAGAGDFVDGHASPKKFTSRPTRIGQPGDIVLSIRASIGARVWADQECCLGRGVAGLRPGPRLDPHFLWHWLGHSEQALKAKGRGATFLQVNRDDIAEMPIILPPLDEQRRVAAILDHADALRAKRRQVITQLDLLKQSLFDDLFGVTGRGLTGSREVALADLFSVKSGSFLPSKNQDGGPYPVFGGNGVTGYHSEYLFDEPKLVIGRVGVYCGAVHLTPPRSWITDNALYATDFREAVSLVYLKDALDQANLNQYSNRSGQPLISGARIGKVALTIPTRRAQEEYVSLVEALYSRRVAAENWLDVANELVSSLQERAFGGRLG